MNNYISFAQILISILLIITILLQRRGTALGSAFSDVGFSYFTRRGLEKILFFSTCILGFIFVVLAILNLIL
jgi:protein translocase SecG subunit